MVTHGMTMEPGDLALSCRNVSEGGNASGDVSRVKLKIFPDLCPGKYRLVISHNYRHHVQTITTHSISTASGYESYNKGWSRVAGFTGR